MIYELPKLEYKYDALEPHIDEVTMRIHHSKHHAAYVNKLNVALESQVDLNKKSLEEILSSLNSIPEDIRTSVRNNGGGHLNHSFFWSIMTPTSDRKELSGKLLKAIEKEFNSFSSFVDEFTKMALGTFGSGWAWLVVSSIDKLMLMSTPNQDSPIIQGCKPILGLDVWEHAYYLRYQNKRADYIDAWWKIVNWKQVEKNFDI